MYIYNLYLKPLISTSQYHWAVIKLENLEKIEHFAKNRHLESAILNFLMKNELKSKFFPFIFSYLPPYLNNGSY